MTLDRFPRIIVTGANGWLGRRVVRALTLGLDWPALRGFAGSTVRAFVPAGEDVSDLSGLGAEIVRGDLRDPDAVTNLMGGAEGAAVIHLAGVIHPGKVRDFDAINHLGTRAVLDAATRAGCARMVVMSSNSPFGANRTPEGRFDETSPYNPYMGYGRSKRRMEDMLRGSMAAAGAPEIVICRAPWFYGPGQPPRQTQFFTMIKDGKFPILGSGDNRRSMGYVDSLALGLLLAAETPRAAAQTYWIADERPYPMTEIVATVRDVLRDDFGMQVSDRSLRVPGIVADMARVADAGLQVVGLYHQKIHVLSEMNLTIACDISKAQRDLGYEPLVELREGMRRSVAWCLEQGHDI